MTRSLPAATHLAVRRLRALSRQPIYLLSFLIQPVIWLLLFGQLFKRFVDVPGFTTDSYIGYLTPGVVVMTALYANGWAGMTLIIDMDRGVMDRFLVAPVRRYAVIAGGAGYQALLTVVQSFIIVGLGLLAGARFHGGFLSVLAFTGCVALLGAAFASFSDAIALAVRKQESVIGVVNFLVLPLAFLSTAFVPSDLAPGWIQAISRVNPVNWAVQAGRETLHPNVDWTLVLTRAVLLFALALLAGFASTRAFRSYQRAI